MSMTPKEYFIVIVTAIIVCVLFVCFTLDVKDLRPPDAALWPCITGKGYEAIIGHGPGRIFKDGIEKDVTDTQIKLGFTGDDLDGKVGGKTGRRMKEFNLLESYNSENYHDLTPEELREVFK